MFGKRKGKSKNSLSPLVRNKKSPKGSPKIKGSPKMKGSPGKGSPLVHRNSPGGSSPKTSGKKMDKLMKYVFQEYSHLCAAQKKKAEDRVRKFLILPFFFFHGNFFFFVHVFFPFSARKEKVSRRLVILMQTLMKIQQ
jgi:hypothetical protein